MLGRAGRDEGRKDETVLFFVCAVKRKMIGCWFIGECIEAVFYIVPGCVSGFCVVVLQQAGYVLMFQPSEFKVFPGEHKFCRSNLSSGLVAFILLFLTRDHLDI